ncbi:MAG TPA: helix-turn-helix domain-containing protein [Candidatus Gemmiger faecavium]|nr:helix-turn-helix domain-containing protein [Candidatus Gemmiger faecavium]
MVLYTPDKLAALLGVSKSTVLRLIRAGEFGQTVNVARQYLVTEDGLGEFIAAHTGPPTTNKSRPQKPRRGTADRNPGPI